MNFAGREVGIRGAVDKFQHALEQRARRFVDVQVPFEFEFAGEESRNRVDGLRVLAATKASMREKRMGNVEKGGAKSPFYEPNKSLRRCSVKEISPEQRKKTSF